MVKLVLPGEKPKSWNEYWSGVHWTKRVEEANRVHLLVRSMIDPDEAELFDVPVHIRISAFFKDRREQLDSPNIVNKPYIDALEGWYIINDDPVHVPSVTTASLIDRENPRMEIEIIPLDTLD